MPRWAKTLGITVVVLIGLWGIYDLMQAGRDVGTIVANGDSGEPSPPSALPGGASNGLKATDDSIAATAFETQWGTLNHRQQEAICNYPEQTWESVNRQVQGAFTREQWDNFVSSKCTGPLSTLPSMEDTWKELSWDTKMVMCSGYRTEPYAEWESFQSYAETGGPDQFIAFLDAHCRK